MAQDASAGSIAETSSTTEVQIKLPEIPLDMSVCDGSDNEDLEVKEEPIDLDIQSEEFPPGLDAHDNSRHALDDAQLQKVTESGKL